MTVTDAYRYICNELYTIYDQREAENIANLAIENITGFKKMDRVLNKTVSLSPSQENTLNQYTSLLLKHQPVQYVLHEAWFYGMKLYVDEQVLIPRPETEELVEWMIHDAKAGQQPLSIIDIGTGSGCIPIALKKKMPAADVWAIDISNEALLVAKKNAAAQQTNITFQQADILAASSWPTFPLFDIIVSNPPYIPLPDKATMQANVLQYEPHTALFVYDDDPLLFYKAIADFACKQLRENGSIYVEIHEALGDDVKKTFIEKGFNNIITRKDMQGKDRMVKAEK